jgi:Gly-Xaa carboxypeptidase
VQQRTESFDYFIQLEANDPALDKHYAFAQWLKDEYPVVLDKLQYEEVNYHGHLLTWQGSNADLKPILLMAHTDTVPVINETLSQWTYPPFEGTIAPAKGLDGQEVPYIWGRGASDCKNSLLGIFGAVEKLAQEGYEPERTILIASGFDEEVHSSLWGNTTRLTT